MNIATPRRDVQRGYGNEERPVTRVLWDRDSIGSSIAMRTDGNVDPSNPIVNFKRYYDPDYAKLEFEHIFLKSWLFACRDEDIPEIGDRVPLAVGGHSFFVIRSDRDQFKAFHNSCLHRGTKLCDGASSGSVIRCPYHAWEWKIDGSLKSVPGHWDFRGINPANGHLREARLARWGGFIFINADPDAAPLEEALGVIPEHFRDFAPENRYTVARFRKLVPANWKIAQEAFMEGYHVTGTHPEGVPFNGDTQSKYDVWETPSGDVGRLVTPSAVPSMNADSDASSVSAALAFAQVMIDWHYPGAQLPTLDPTDDIRKQLGEWHREVWADKYKRAINAPDAAMMDSVLYFAFPQFTIWLCESIPFTYQFLPHPRDPELSYFDVRMLYPVVEGAVRPPSSPAIEVGLGEMIFEKAPAFGFLGYIFDQDMSNMPLVQEGVRSSDPARGHSLLGTYQEQLIQHWNAVLDRRIAEGVAESARS